MGPIALHAEEERHSVVDRRTSGHRSQLAVLFLCSNLASTNGKRIPQVVATAVSSVKATVGFKDGLRFAGWIVSRNSCLDWEPA